MREWHWELTVCNYVNSWDGAYACLSNYCLANGYSGGVAAVEPRSVGDAEPAMQMLGQQLYICNEKGLRPF